MADRISYDSLKKEWVLYNVTHRYNDGLNERLNMQPELRAHYAFTLKDLVQDLDSKDAMTTPRLWSYIQQEKLRGRETLNALYIELHRRTATPFACFILTIMGVCIASTKKRGGGGVHLAIGIFVSAVFFMITQFSSILSTKAGFSPFLATWIPNLIFSCIAYLLYKKQIK
jgi:lipopolysaccharide export system permease protein